MEEYSLMVLQEAFERIRDVFFPQWDCSHEWTVEVGCRGNSCLGRGYCDTEGKKILINLFLINSSDPDETLIHEICHAVASTYHGKKWQGRMEKAVLKAESLGNKELAEKIRKDYTAYSDPDKCLNLTANMVYTKVEDVAIETEWSFEDVINFVADGYCMTSKQLLAKYKRLRTVYEKTMREWHQ
jgi:hypothetical protein